MLPLPATEAPPTAFPCPHLLPVPCSPKTVCCLQDSLLLPLLGIYSCSQSGRCPPCHALHCMAFPLIPVALIYHLQMYACQHSLRTADSPLSANKLAFFKSPPAPRVTSTYRSRRSGAPPPPSPLPQFTQFACKLMCSSNTGGRQPPIRPAVTHSLCGPLWGRRMARVSLRPHNLPIQ